jgi:hypothetical protein
MTTNFLGGVSILTSGFSPITLFTDNEQGAWYDPSDITTLFQDDAGTTPVTAAGQSVGRMLDKSGRGNHATQANVAQRPLYDIDGNGNPYLLFDGSDDGMATGNIVPGTDKAQVFAGARKLSDTGVGVIANNGNPFTTQSTVALGASTALGDASRRTWFGNTRGTGAAQSLRSTGIFAAPDTAVLSGLYDNAGAVIGDAIKVRRNGVEGPYVGATLAGGTGNYATAPINIGFYSPGSPFNGRIYGVIVRFGANLSTEQIQQTEAWIAERTGVTIP